MTVDPAYLAYLQNQATHLNNEILARERSKWRFYAVKNGTNGDKVYSSRTQVYPYCWNPETQYFFPGYICKGVDCYEFAWDFLLGLTP